MFVNPRGHEAKTGRTGIGGYINPSQRDKYDHKPRFGYIDMADYTNPSDLPPSELYEVSISTAFLLDFRPQSSVYVHIARRIGLSCLGEGITLPESPRLPPDLRFNWPRIPLRTPPRDTIEYTINPGSSTEFSPQCPRQIEPSTPNGRHLVCVTFIVSSTSDSNISPTKLE